MQTRILGMVALVLCFGWLAVALRAQVPVATPRDYATAQLAISLDGRTVTVRGVAPDSLRFCVEPRADRFGPIRCFTVGDVRRGVLIAQ